MKTSNKIIIVLSVFIIGSIIVFFSTAKAHEKHNKENVKESRFQLKPFSVVVIEDSAVARVRTTSQITTTKKDGKGKIAFRRKREMNEMIVYYHQGKKPQFNQLFCQKGDTLYICRGAKISVQTSGKIQSVIANNPKYLFLEGVKTKQIAINGGKAYLVTSPLDGANKQLTIDLKNNAKVQLDGRDFASFDITSVNSIIDIKLTSKEKIKTLNVSLRNLSFMTCLDSFTNTNIQKDSSSSGQVLQQTYSSWNANEFDDIVQN